MSPAKKDRKIQSAFGKDIPHDEVINARFAQAIADALHRDFGETHSAVKIVVKRTKANERAVKNWFMAKNGPTGRLWSIWSAFLMKCWRPCCSCQAGKNSSWPKNSRTQSRC